MEKETLDAVRSVVEHLLKHNAVKAVKYLAPNLVVRAVRTRFNKKILGYGNKEVTLTIGKPNYLERDAIKECQKAGEPFPVKKVRLKLPPVDAQRIKPKKHD